MQDAGTGDLIGSMAGAASPDLALSGLVRLLEADAASGSESGVRAAVAAGGRITDRLTAVLGSSPALADHLAGHPEQWRALAEEASPGSGQAGRSPLDDAGQAARLRAELLAAVGADPKASAPVSTLARDAGYDALRVAYRRRLLAVAARDLTAPDPALLLADVAAELADLAAAALEAGLAIARGELGPAAAGARIAVIGMGKCGGRELNYVSDVDVIYVVEPPDGADASSGAEAGALDVGTRLAAGLARACSTHTGEGTLWPVDAALRPEGRAGPLVRTVASHLSYYERWAQTWEFQAVLKARCVAGDRGVADAYLDAIMPLVWRAAERDNFVEDVQAMRRRVEQHIPARDADRQLKLGRGGLRDVEFSVQLLQLVHGRADPRLRTGNTLLGLEALSTYGYVGRDDASEMDRAYRMLRTLEHRLQLYRLRRTHVLPHDIHELRRLGRSLGYRTDPADTLVATWRRNARTVRRLHEKLFYRPLLGAAARLTTEETRLTPEAARTRLAALGYRDPAGAMRHLASLTEGVSRRAADPAPAAAGDARLVRRRCRPGRRPARVPPGQRRASAPPTGT